MAHAEIQSDGDLVAATLAGDQRAFARIVERYQRLLCSLAYTTTGSLNESEDLAQEAFVTAWQQLDRLREPAKLRAWLCTILRHKLSRSFRKQRREPVAQAAALEVVGEVSTADEPTAQQTMKKEEQQMLWHALEQLPPNYREPLVLFYREHQSIEHVADALDLTESTVKQRLSRGRKMLQEKMLEFVEGALARTTPGAAFTAGVMATIATLSPPAKAAIVGAAAAHTAASAKTFSLAALLASIAGFVSTFLAIRAGLDQSRTDRERRAVVKTGLSIAGSCLLFFGGLYGLFQIVMRGWVAAGPTTVLAVVSLMVFIVVWLVGNRRVLANMRRFRAGERERAPEAFSHPDDAPISGKGEFKTRWEVWGIPLVHIRFGHPELGSRPVVGWIAGGDRAYGILFAWGLWAVGFIAVGSCSFGVISIGAVGIGVFGLGSVGIGFVAWGAAAVGYHAFASLLAVGWHSAQSAAFAVAELAAAGRIAYAKHANDEAAWALLLQGPQLDFYSLLFMGVVTIFTLVPGLLYATEVRRRRRRMDRPQQ